MSRQWSDTAEQIRERSLHVVEYCASAADAARGRR